MTLLSGSGRGRDLFTDTLNGDPDVAEREAAVMVAAAHARDADDLRDLLCCLGLDA